MRTFKLGFSINAIALGVPQRALCAFHCIMLCSICLTYNCCSPIKRLEDTSSLESASARSLLSSCHAQCFAYTPLSPTLPLPASQVIKAPLKQPNSYEMKISSNGDTECLHQPICGYNTCFRDARLQIYTPLCEDALLQHLFSRMDGGTFTLNFFLNFLIKPYLTIIRAD